MSYDDKDRHEIAARLRSKKPEEFGPRYGRNVLEHIFHSLFPKQVYPVSNWVLRMPYTLADLIDRPTCHLVLTDTETHGNANVRCYECSECGGACEEIYGKYERCPHCGAEVVADD